MITKYCPHCHHDLNRSCFTSTRAKYCNPCKRIIQLEQKQAMTERSLARTKIKKQKTVGILKVSDLKRAIQKEVNAYVRLRDKDLSCISCQRFVEDKEAGHYLSQGSTGILRYELDNLSGQCGSCNRWKHGNLIEYRINLVKKLGLARVEALEAIRHQTKTWTREELLEVREKIKNLTKKLNGERTTI